MIRELRQYHVTCDGNVPDGSASRCGSQRMTMAYDEGDLREKLRLHKWRVLDNDVVLCPGLHAPLNPDAPQGDSKEES